MRGRGVLLDGVGRCSHLSEQGGSLQALPPSSPRPGGEADPGVPLEEFPREGPWFLEAHWGQSLPLPLLQWWGRGTPFGAGSLLLTPLSLPVLHPALPSPSIHPPPLSGLPCFPGPHTLVSLILTCPFSLLCPPVFAFSITSRFKTSIPCLPSCLPVSLPAGSPGLPALTFLLTFPVRVLQVTCPQEPSSLGRALSSDSSSAPPPAWLTFN